MTKALITIDEKLCIKDGICAAECPVKILGFPEKGEVPSLVSGREVFCIACGHCVSVCPTGALSLRFLKPEDCIKIDKDLVLDKNSVGQLLGSRRAIRNYKEEAVDKEKLEELINMAAYAPTGHNSRSVKWLVIHDTKEVRRLSSMVADWMRYMIKEHPDMAKGFHLEETVQAYELGIDTISRNAPHLIVALAHKAAPTGAIDCANALAYLELAAPSLGLGSCWAGFFNIAASFWPPLKEALNLPKGVNNNGALLIGVPKFSYHRIPPRKPRSIDWR